MIIIQNNYNNVIFMRKAVFAHTTSTHVRRYVCTSVCMIVFADTNSLSPQTKLMLQGTPGTEL